MEYETLCKLYYKDTDIYKQTYEIRFNSPESFKLDFEIEGNQAFFIQNREMVELMFKILRLDKDIALLCSKLPRKALLQYSRKCLIDEIVLTNDIEGVHSSRKEIGEALFVLENRSEEKKRKTRFAGLVNKYFKLSSGEEVPLSTCEDIRSLYDEIVLKEVREEDPNNIPDGKLFRKDKTSVVSATGKEIHPGMTPESKIIEYMTKALNILNEDGIEKLYRISLFHYMIGYIHPFYDGNGRIARFIFSYCLSCSMEHIWAYRISEAIKENKKDYYKAFEICNDYRNKGDLTPFIIMMLNVVYNSGKELFDSLYKKSIVWARYEKIAEDFKQAEDHTVRKLYSVLIQAALFSEEGISTIELLDFLNISRSGLKQKLDIVKEQGLLCQDKKGRENFYQKKKKKMDELSEKQ